MEIRVDFIDPILPIPYDLLLLADPSKNQIDSYYQAKNCLVASSKNKILATLVFQVISTESIEIMNIAVHDSFQKKGIGSRMLEYFYDFTKSKNFSNVRLGTSDAIAHPLSWYQKQGFKKIGIKKNFFLLNYSEPVMDEGVRCIDMIILEKKLT